MVIHPHRNHKKNGRKGLFDYAIYPISILASIMTIPQLLQVWVDKNVDGVSVVTWGSYAAIALLWFLYGVTRKQPPLIVGNLCIAILDVAIIIGVMHHS